MDRGTYVTGVAVFVIAIVAAATLPAMRALRVQPIAVFRGG
jgi:ABC-type lipoprotein release transport system permease subunit